LSGLGDSALGRHHLHLEGYVTAACCDVMGVTQMRSRLVTTFASGCGQEKSPAVRGAKSKKTVDV
jgi:hypothetical protein